MSLSNNQRQRRHERNENDMIMRQGNARQRLEEKSAWVNEIEVKEREREQARKMWLLLLLSSTVSVSVHTNRETKTMEKVENEIEEQMRQSARSGFLFLLLLLLPLPVCYVWHTMNCFALRRSANSVIMLSANFDGHGRCRFDVKWARMREIFSEAEFSECIYIMYATNHERRQRKTPMEIILFMPWLSGQSILCFVSLQLFNWMHRREATAIRGRFLCDGGFDWMVDDAKAYNM